MQQQQQGVHPHKQALEKLHRMVRPTYTLLRAVTQSSAVGSSTITPEMRSRLASVGWAAKANVLLTDFKKHDMNIVKYYKELGGVEVCLPPLRSCSVPCFTVRGAMLAAKDC